MADAATFSALQLLGDGEFHQLCDELFPELESRYRFLTPYGITPHGKSVRGRPDSYVGNSAESCTIAFEYSTQKNGWQRKLIDDVNEVKGKCPNVEEIVLATCVNVDRSRSKKYKDWLRTATEIANPTLLTIFSGPKIGHLLDTTRQELRFRYLGIQCGRLSAESILASCQKWNDDAIRRLIAQGRYFPDDYVVRDSDEQLYWLWQQATANARSSDGACMLPIVGDSGIGKTSFVARFVQSIHSVAPVVLLPARDIDFISEDAIVRNVLASIQGVIGDESRRKEEAVVVGVLGGNREFTVVLDGLDEAVDAYGLRRAVSFWLNSELGQRAVLVVTSRPEFWQRCQDAWWRRHIISPAVIYRDSDLRSPSDAKRLGKPDILRLSVFTDVEAATAWELLGHARDEYFSFPSDVRVELRHPFTLHAFSELLNSGSNVTGPQTRTGIMERWLDARLQAECRESRPRLSPEMLHDALKQLAKLVATVGESWLRIDQLAGVPGFSPSCPPGTANAN